MRPDSCRFWGWCCLRCRLWGTGRRNRGGDAVFLFLVWAGLIAAALVLAPHLVRSERDSDGPLPEGEAGAEPGASGDKGAGGNR